MGRELFDKYKELIVSANSILNYDIELLCTKDPDRLLNKTQFTQPALYVTDVLMYMEEINEKGKPDYVLGHSLGEYVALYAAGAYTFETGLKLVKMRAEIMQKMENGGMAALLGLSIGEVEELIQASQLDIDIANYNSREQIVISGLKLDIIAAQPLFEANGAKLYFPLNVSGAFHSRYMKTAAANFSQYVRQVSFSQLKIPVIANVTARPYSQNEIARLLEDQIASPVKWYESISYLLHSGVTEFREIGPGEVLTKMLHFIQNNPAPMHMEVSPPKEISPAPYFIRPENLGDAAFKKDYNLRYAYVSGAMVHGIASKELVIKMAKAGLMGYLGTGGVRKEKVERDILFIHQELEEGQSYGVNLLNGPNEKDTVDLLLKHKVRNVEAAAYMLISEDLVRLRLTGVSANGEGTLIIPTRIMAKLSRPEVAAGFLSPAPRNIVEKLLRDNILTAEEAMLGQRIPMADDICVEADSGGHTDMGVAFVLLPAIMLQRDEFMLQYHYKKKIRVGAAGGIGTPAAAAAAFALGADFILTGSINQCTIEAGTSDIVKNMLQEMNVQDTTYAPAGDMFEIGAKIQVFKKGVLFPARANKLYDLYRQYSSLADIDAKTKSQIEEKYFQRSFDQVHEDCKAYYSPSEMALAERNPKQLMAYIFRWYFGYSGRIAEQGDEKNKVDFQIHCGPALGAFNQFVKGTSMENWRNRHVDEIAQLIMEGAASLLNDRLGKFSSPD